MINIVNIIKIVYYPALRQSNSRKTYAIYSYMYR